MAGNISNNSAGEEDDKEEMQPDQYNSDGHSLNVGI